MAVNVTEALKDGFAVGVQNMKTFVIPMVIGVIVIALIVGFFPGLKKFLA